MHKKDAPQHHHKPSEERSVSGEVKVHGGIQIFETDSAIEQHKSERKEDETYKSATKTFEKSSLLATRVGLIISALYFIATSFIFFQSKKAADAAKSAAGTANRQLTDSEAIQRAQLVIEFGDHSTYEEKGDLYIRGIIKVVNVGQTAAVQFAIRHGTGGGITRPEHCPWISDYIAADPNGPSIPGGKDFEYPYDFLLGRADKIDKSLEFGFYDVGIAYKDLFGGAGYYYQWYIYDRYWKKLIPCPMQSIEKKK